jgi:outer membrane protein OmpA-like peptidoglycan-associated protein/opacity protein-like surface antigen
MSAFSQNPDQKWSLWLGTGPLQYKGEIGNQFNKLNDYKMGYQVAVSRYLSKSFDVSFDLDLRLLDESGGKSDKWQVFGSVLAPTINLHYKLNNGYLLKENSLFQPYVKVGTGAFVGFTKGVSASNDQKYDDTKIASVLTYGIGTKVKVSEKVSLFAEVNDNLTSSDKFDASTGSKKNDSFRRFTIGVIFRLGKAKDDDNDGVPNRKDKCPETPIGAKVDENGCPIDTDSDGIIDLYDECVDVAGLEAFNGCPDTDGDGVKDSDDECPDTPKGSEVDEKGCVVVVEEIIEEVKPLIPQKITDVPELMVKFEPIYFRTNSAEIDASEKMKLDNMAKLLIKHAIIKDVLLSGHTDPRGSSTYNLKLSEKRAKAVLSYLLNKGVGEKRVQIKALGEAHPVSKQASLKEYQKDRRVEFQLND